MEVTKTIAVPEAKQIKGDKVANYLTCFGHICSDINQGALAAVLPFLVALRGYSYTSVAMLVFVANLASGLVQPVFGTLGDRRPTPWLMGLGVLIAGAGMAVIGIAPNYPLVVVSAMISGVGVAMFHPEGGRLANLAAGEHKGNGMSIFAVGGNIGFFLGPIITSVALGAFGMAGTYAFLIPATACALILFANNRRFVALGAGKASKKDSAAAASDAPERPGMFAGVLAVLSLRSIVGYGLTSFVSLYLIGTFGASQQLGSTVVSLTALAGGVSTILSGRLAERFGSWQVMIAGLGCSALLAFGLATTNSVALVVAFALAFAVAKDAYYASTVALGMSYMPQHLGTASGLCYGVAVCVGGVAEPFLGSLGDHAGLGLVFWVLAIVSAAGTLLAFVLSKKADSKTSSNHGEVASC